MKKLILAVAALTVVSLTHSANAQAASATANATATVVAPIAISKTADLRFGSLSASAAPGTVVMTTAGVRFATGGATLQVGATQAQGAYTGTFNVTVNYN